MSASHWHEPIDLEEDWLVAIFGSDPESAKTSSSFSSLAPVQPAQDDDEAQDGEIAQPPPPDDDSEEPGQVAVRPGSLKLLYDFRRILHKLPLLASSDPTQVKRFIVGLHERVWHAPVGDVRNILQRCGQPWEVVLLAAEAVASCAVGRKYSRAGRRPQHRGAHLSPSFNGLVQMDVFQFRDHLFMLVIDEATRYKVATSCPGRYLKDLLGTLMKCWIRYFGPMKVFVTDQESALMTIKAGEEFQRVGMERRPAGTTTKKQGQMHTTTGLVERHIDLVKMSMLKIQAESGRYGIGFEMEELAAEAAMSMSQNLTMSVGGYTPSILLFGVLPRGFP